MEAIKNFNWAQDKVRELSPAEKDEAGLTPAERLQKRACQRRVKQLANKRDKEAKKTKAAAALG